MFEAHLGALKSASVFNGVLVTENPLSVLFQVWLLHETEAPGLSDPGASCALRLSELLFDLSPQQTLVLGQRGLVKRHFFTPTVTFGFLSQSGSVSAAGKRVSLHFSSVQCILKW